MLEDEAEATIQRVIDLLDWKGPVFRISAIGKEGTKELTQALMEFLDENPRTQKELEEAREPVNFKWDEYHQATLTENTEPDDDDDDWDEEDDDGHVVYTRE